MLNSCRIFACRIQKVLLNASRPAKTVATNLKIEIEMKRLNDQRQFCEALVLFDKLQHREVQNDRTIVQALKACTGMRDLKRGVNIHSQLSNRSSNDPYIQSALIHFYSELNLSLVSDLRCWILVQCGDVINARRVFASSSEKSMPLCGAMMKGETSLSLGVNRFDISLSSRLYRE